MTFNKYFFAVAAVFVISILSSFFTVSAAQTGKCTADALNIRSGAGTSYSKTGMLYYGDTVTVESTVKGSDGSEWYKISYSKSGSKKSGYVSSEYISVSGSQQVGSSDKDFESYLDKQGFPES